MCKECKFFPIDELNFYLKPLFLMASETIIWSNPGKLCHFRVFSVRYKLGTSFSDGFSLHPWAGHSSRGLDGI